MYSVRNEDTTILKEDSKISNEPEQIGQFPSNNTEITSRSIKILTKYDDYKPSLNTTKSKRAKLVE